MPTGCPSVDAHDSPQPTRPAARQNVFERHRKKTLLVIVMVSVIGIDLTAGLLLKIHRRRLTAAELTFRQPSEIYGWGLTPLMDTTGHWGNCDYRLKTNTLGFKDRTTRQVNLKSSQPRIVFIGDSFTEGIGVDFEDSYVGRLEAALRQRGIEVLNAGVCGYSPVNYVRKMKYLVEDMGLELDELVVAIDISDAPDDIAFLHREALSRKTGSPILPAFSPPDQPLNWCQPLSQTLRDFVSEYTVVTHFVLKRLKDLVVEPPRATDAPAGRWTKEGPDTLNVQTRGIELNTKHMDALLALLRKHGIRLTVVVYPWPQQIRYRELDCLPVRHWRSWAARNKVDFVNLFPRFIDDRPWQQVIKECFIPGDIHWNEAGHREIAAGILEYVKAREKTPGDLHGTFDSSGK